MNRAARIVGTIVMAAAITVSNFVSMPYPSLAATSPIDTEINSLISDFQFGKAQSMIKKYIDQDCIKTYRAGGVWPGQKVSGTFVDYFTYNKNKDYNYSSCIILSLKGLKNSSNPKSKYSIFFYFKSEQGKAKTFSYKLAGSKTPGLGFYASLKLAQRQAMLKSIRGRPNEIIATALVEEVNGKTTYYDCPFYGTLTYEDMSSQFGLNGSPFPASTHDANTLYFELIYMGTPKVSQGSVGIEFRHATKQSRLITFFDGNADLLWTSFKTGIEKSYIARNLDDDFTQIQVVLFVNDPASSYKEVELGSLESVISRMFVDLLDPNFSEVKNITDQFFEIKVEKIKGSVLVDFYGPECKPCDEILPHLQRLAIKQSAVKVYRIDASQNPNSADKYHVTGWPTLILFTGGKYVDERMGLQTYEQLKQFIGYQEAPPSPPAPLFELTDDNFASKIEKRTGYSFAFFYDQCADCEKMIEELKLLNHRTLRAWAAQFAFDSSSATCKKYKIAKAHCLVLFLDGKEITRTTEFLDYGQLKDLLGKNGCRT